MTAAAHSPVPSPRASSRRTRGRLWGRLWGRSQVRLRSPWRQSWWRSSRWRVWPSRELRHAFVELPAAELSRISVASTQIELGSGTVLCREGEFGREVLLLLDGTVTVARADEALGVGAGPSVVGELAVMSRTRRVATVVASSPVIVAVSTPAEFSAILASCPQFARYVTALARARWEALVDDLILYARPAQ